MALPTTVFGIEIATSRQYVGRLGQFLQRVFARWPYRGGGGVASPASMENSLQVYFGWGGSKYNTLGYLHWGLNQYKANPFDQSVVKHPSPAASANNFLPAGDTHIIYPGKNGPLSSLRFESHRIGSEDYEILEILKRKKPKKHKKLVGKVFTDHQTYSLNIKKYYRVKKRILKTTST